MKLATLKQAKKVLELLESLPSEQLQNLLASGLFSDLSEANVDEVNRDEFRKLCGLTPVSTEFPVWKTIKLGMGLKTADDFCQVLNDGGFRTSDWAMDIFKRPDFTAANQETELDLVKVTVAELGFKSGARRDQIYARAKELGLEICPSEVGPQLRLQYKDQPNGEWILIGMEPITDSDGALRVFGVECDASVLWLHSFCGCADDFWAPARPWVFLRPRK